MHLPSPFSLSPSFYQLRCPSWLNASRGDKVLAKVGQHAVEIMDCKSNLVWSRIVRCMLCWVHLSERLSILLRSLLVAKMSGQILDWILWLISRVWAGWFILPATQALVKGGWTGYCVSEKWRIETLPYGLQGQDSFFLFNTQKMELSWLGFLRKDETNIKIEKGKNKTLSMVRFIYTTQTTTRGKFNKSSLSTSKRLSTLSTTILFLLLCSRYLTQWHFGSKCLLAQTMKDSEVRLDDPTTTLTRNLNFLSWSRVFVLLY